MHAVVARSTFPSQNVQSTPGSDNFFEVAMSKKCAPLWREAHFEAKMLIKGPDNPTRQLLPIMSAKGCSRDGEGRKGKGGGEGSKS